MPRRGVSANARSSLAASKNQSRSGHGDLAVDDDRAGLVEMHHQPSAPDSRLVAAIAWMLPTCVTSMVSRSGGMISGSARRSCFQAALIGDKIGDIDQVQHGVLADRAEFGELGGFNRPAILAGDQLQFARCRACEMRRRSAPPARCPSASRLRWIEQSLKFMSLDSVWLPGALECRSRTTWPGFLSSAQTSSAASASVAGQAKQDDQTPETETHNRFRKTHCR